MASTMSCRVTVYSSPFGAVDRADSEATLLASTTAVSSFDCDLLPYRNGIHVRCYTSDCSNIETASYLKLKYTALQMPIFAVITETIPIDADTWEFVTEIAAELTVIPHATSISGITERVHVPKADDTLGAYIEEDPYLGCAQPLEIEQEYCFTESGFRSGDSYHIVAANMDLNLLGFEDFNTALEWGKSGSTKSVVTPKEASLKTTYTITSALPSFTYDTTGLEQYIAQDVINVDTGLVEKRIEKSPVTHYFDGEVSKVTDGVAKAHALGSSDGIIASYLVPKSFVHGKLVSDKFNTCGRFNDGTLTNGWCITGGMGEKTTSLRFDNSNVQNKRLLVGAMNKYGIASIAGGETAEFNPEDIMFDSKGNLLAAPNVIFSADITENGRPSFKFKFVNGAFDMLRGIVAGAQWKNAPISNMRAEGYERHQRKFDNDTAIQQYNVHKQQNAGFASLLGGIASGGRSAADNANIGTTISGGTGGPISQISYARGALSQTIFGGETSNLGSNLGVEIVGTGLKALSQTITNFSDNHYGEKVRMQELEQLVYNDSFVAPTVLFPCNATVRDFIGNGVLAYRYHPTQADLTRLDKILNMFGYKVTKELELSDFSNRSRYNYVKASAVHIVAPAFPRYIIEAAEESIMMGVRIWHVPYDGNYTIANN